MGVAGYRICTESPEMTDMEVGADRPRHAEE
jgi:hypothetical protein